eukprot:GFUD01019660.1.p1 GENE.GFUD01019660.1~~GFUD01019660.1.p1  ORF type:complete len:438 (+),score=115.74 GFUD01019660.1:79-1392(+)
MFLLSHSSPVSKHLSNNRPVILLPILDPEVPITVPVIQMLKTEQRHSTMGAEESRSKKDDLGSGDVIDQSLKVEELSATDNYVTKKLTEVEDEANSLHEKLNNLETSLAKLRTENCNLRCQLSFICEKVVALEMHDVHFINVIKDTITLELLEKMNSLENRLKVLESPKVLNEHIEPATTETKPAKPPQIKSDRWEIHPPMTSSLEIPSPENKTETTTKEHLSEEEKRKSLDQLGMKEVDNKTKGRETTGDYLITDEEPCSLSELTEMSDIDGGSDRLTALSKKSEEEHEETTIAHSLECDRDNNVNELLEISGESLVDSAANEGEDLLTTDVECSNRGTDDEEGRADWSTVSAVGLVEHGGECEPCEGADGHDVWAETAVSASVKEAVMSGGTNKHCVGGAVENATEDGHEEQAGSSGGEAEEHAGLGVYVADGCK